MKKTYKFNLPQSKEVEKTNIRVENGEILVDVELKDKFEPKDGDFCISETGLIFIYKKSCYESAQSYIGIDSHRQISLVSCYYNIKKNSRYATEAEKSAFLNRLEKEYHKRWNTKTKTLEDIRWMPNLNEKYYFIDSRLHIAFAYYTSSFSEKDMINIGNCFHTLEAAQKVADQIKEIFKNSKAE